MLELAILGVLQEQPLHGYELKKRLSEMLGSFWGVSFGSLYPALRRLERAEAIEVVAGIPSDEHRHQRPGRCPPTGSLKGEAAAARLRLRAEPGRADARARPTGSPPAARSSSSQLLTADDTGDDERLFTLKLAFCRFLDARRAHASSSPAAAPSSPIA